MISAGATIARRAAVTRHDPPMPPRRLTPLLPLLAALGCASDGPTAAQLALRDGTDERVPITRVRSEPLALTSASGVFEPARLVVRDEPLWRATWTAIWSRQEPPPDVPAVDFAGEMVVVVALGARPSGGHAIVVDSATLHGGTLVVHVRASAPGPRCAVTGAFTAPVDAARLPRHDGPIEFRERVEDRSCD